jgi:hypothetical protein
MPLYVFAAYSFICILLPKYLQQKKYAAFVIAALAVALCNFIGGIFLSMLHFKLMDWHMAGINKSLASFRTSIYQGIMLAFFATGGMATVIKLTKNWYLQQIENIQLAKQKSSKQIKLLKAHIRPVFLFQSLNILHKKIISCEDDSPTMVLQLSELLSHLLYDCDEELISLNQELEMVKLLVDIKKFDKHRHPSIKILIYGDGNQKYISPVLLFSYLQTVLNDAEENTIKKNALDIVLNIENKKLLCELHGCIESVTEFNLCDFSEAFKPAENITIVHV